MTATPLYSGKVRDVYDAREGRLLFVASDRMSAFDVVTGRFAMRDFALTREAPASVELRLGGRGSTSGFVLDSDGIAPLLDAQVEGVVVVAGR